MNIDNARVFLMKLFKVEYSRYIDVSLAGDFAVEVAGTIEQLQAERDALREALEQIVQMESADGTEESIAFEMLAIAAKTLAP